VRPERFELPTFWFVGLRAITKSLQRRCLFLGARLPRETL